MASSLSLSQSLSSSFRLSFQTKNHQRRASTKVSCNASENDEKKLDRRDMLLGLGGLYGAVGMAASSLPAAATPVQAPDLFTAKKIPDDLPAGVVTECRAPASRYVDYVLPRRPGLRVRPAAHMADKEYVAKYDEALRRMRALPDDDPRSFKQQAMVHCAYCNGGYDQVGFGDLDIQVHFNWLFFPFHRWYLYFYERILGSLIGDPNFAIPFWNWDAPDGMTMPAMFTNPKSSLYDEFRSKLHQPPYVLDLNYDYKNAGSNVALPRDEQIKENLDTMYIQMVSGAKAQELFFGAKYHAGEPLVKVQGSIENSPHTQLHVLCGSERSDATPNGEDMGNFYSAGRDPMFYAHHGNVDRMWTLWKQLPGKKRKDFDDADWLDSAFLFYDENAKLVRVKVRDCLDTRNLGYVYDSVPIPWLFNKRQPHHKPHRKTRGVAHAADVKRVALSDFPVTIVDAPVTVMVPRPKKGRTDEEKEEKEEVLVVKGIDFDPKIAVKFDVYVNDEDDIVGTTRPSRTEFAGSFGNVPHSAGHNSDNPAKMGMKLGITDLLEDLGVDDDENIAVTLVPKTGDPITIDGIEIELMT